MQVIWTIHWITRLHEQHCSECLETKSFTENLGWSREILNIFKATWYFQICKGFVIHEEMEEKLKWAHLRDWLIKEYACLSLALIQSSLHQQISSTYTDNCWRYSCGTLLHASRIGLSVLNSKCMLFAHGKPPFLLDQAPMSPSEAFLDARRQNWLTSQLLAPHFPNNSTIAYR